MKVEECNFISALSTLDAAVLIESTSHNIKNCSFISNDEAVEIDAVGIYTFDALMFTGNTTDINNTSGGSVTVNCTNGSNPGTYTGDTTINNAVNITIWVKDEAGNPVNLAQCAVYKSSDDSQLMNEDTDATGKAEETYNYIGDTDVYFRVRKSSPGVTRYFPVKGTGTIKSTGLTAYVTLIEDAIAEP